MADGSSAADGGGGRWAVGGTAGGGGPGAALGAAWASTGRRGAPGRSVCVPPLQRSSERRRVVRGCVRRL